MPTDAPADGPVTAATRQQLVVAGRLDTPAGQRAILAAQRMESGQEHGSAVSALMTQHQAALDRAMEGAARPADIVDELKARRERRRA